MELIKNNLGKYYPVSLEYSLTQSYLESSNYEETETIAAAKEILYELSQQTSITKTMAKIIQTPYLRIDELTSGVGADVSGFSNEIVKERERLDIFLQSKPMQEIYKLLENQCSFNCEFYKKKNKYTFFERCEIISNKSQLHLQYLANLLVLIAANIDKLPLEALNESQAPCNCNSCTEYYYFQGKNRKPIFDIDRLYEHILVLLKSNKASEPLLAALALDSDSPEVWQHKALDPSENQKTVAVNKLKTIAEGQNPINRMRALIALSLIQTQEAPPSQVHISPEDSLDSSVFLRLPIAEGDDGALGKLYKVARQHLQDNKPTESLQALNTLRVLAQGQKTILKTSYPSKPNVRNARRKFTSPAEERLEELTKEKIGPNVTPSHAKKVWEDHNIYLSSHNNIGDASFCLPARETNRALNFLIRAAFDNLKGMELLRDIATCRLNQRHPYLGHYLEIIHHGGLPRKIRLKQFFEQASKKQSETNIPSIRQNIYKSNNPHVDCPLTKKPILLEICSYLGPKDIESIAATCQRVFLSVIEDNTMRLGCFSEAESFSKLVLDKLKKFPYLYNITTINPAIKAEANKILKECGQSELTLPKLKKFSQSSFVTPRDVEEAPKPWKMGTCERRHPSGDQSSDEDDFCIDTRGILSRSHYLYGWCK